MLSGVEPVNVIETAKVGIYWASTGVVTAAGARLSFGAIVCNSHFKLGHYLKYPQFNILQRIKNVGLFFRLSILISSLVSTYCFWGNGSVTPPQNEEEN